MNRKIQNRIEKNEMILSSIVNTYFQADQSQKLFGQLLNNPGLLARWDGSYAASGASSIRFSLYMYVLSEMRAILFDTHEKVASIHNVLKTLKDEKFLTQLRKWFCDTSQKEIFSFDGSLSEETKNHFRAEDSKSKAIWFEKLLEQATTNYEALLTSEIGSRVNNARNKMISHKEFRSVEGAGRRLFEANDFDLVYSDAKDIIEMSHDIIFPLYSLFTKSHFDSKHSMEHHEIVAKEFWAK
ncbi:AbiU2 domain-containing protein [Salinivibrio sp. IB872]|uniref:AbiU2 domain-containing protein n=1 Tax=Salinivibrio sp. IB872 TaxID=1766123 RepID=UPI0009859427|nr:hypothetical protein [Salinivibrio sp. IB872]OOF27780.1 hypothetical protein BZJ18_07250 [Salinivibrio sp. IB872]